MGTITTKKLRRQPPVSFHEKATGDSRDRISFFYEGKAITGEKGDSIAAAITAVGVNNMSRARSGKSRGMYCGMGACFECMVAVDGRPSQRSCLTTIENGMDVRSQGYLGNIDEKRTHPPEKPPAEAGSIRHTELLIVGAGPGGLSSAISAAKFGVEVIVVDERAYPGGQYFKQPAGGSKTPTEIHFDQQADQGRSLIGTAHALGIEILTKATVWNARRCTNGFQIYIFRKNDYECFHTSQLIVATGAYERPYPVSGWTLPGFLTTGAVQTLVRAYGVAPGTRVLVAGNGPLNLQVAVELLEGGVEVAAVVEASNVMSLWNAGALVAGALASPTLITKGMSYLRTLKQSKVPILNRTILIRAEGVDRVERAVTNGIDGQGTPIQGKEHQFEVDTVCVGYGFFPANELTRILGCEHYYDNQTGGLLVNRDWDGATSYPGLFSIGDGGHVRGAQVALAQGFLAGFSAAKNLDYPTSRSSELGFAKLRFTQHQIFQRALWSLYNCPRAIRIPNPDDSVTICRCEEISAGKIRRAIREGSDEIGSLKKMTRVGMGRCQGRYCGPLVAQILARECTNTPNVWSWFAPRFPIKPILGLPSVKTPEQWDESRQGVDIPRPIQNSDAVYDSAPHNESEVIVIGAGILGTCTAYFLAQNGIDVVLLERGEPNGEASGNNAGSLHVQLLAYDFSLGQFALNNPAERTLPLQLESTRMWPAFAEELNQDVGIDITGGLMVAETDAQMKYLEKKIGMERALGINVELISKGELRDLAPVVAEHLIGASWCPDEGKIDPLVSTQAVLSNALKVGVRLHKQTTVVDITKRNGRFAVMTSRGCYTAPKIVNAAGGWSSAIASMVGINLPIRGHPIQIIVTEPIPHMLDQLLAYAGRHLTLKQVANGNLLIGGGWPSGLDPATSRPAVTQKSFEGNLWVAQRAVPMLQQIHVIRSWAAMNVKADGAPILGECKQVPGFYHAVSVNGITLGPLIGQMTAEAIRTESNAPGMESLTVERFR